MEALLSYLNLPLALPVTPQKTLSMLVSNWADVFSPYIYSHSLLEDWEQLVHTSAMVRGLPGNLIYVNWIGEGVGGIRRGLMSPQGGWCICRDEAGEGCPSPGCTPKMCRCSVDWTNPFLILVHLLR